MRFHRAELAFYVFMTLLLISAATLVYCAWSLGYVGTAPTSAGLDAVRTARTGILVSLLTTGTALLFGVLYILPMIRTQVREEDSLRQMTQSLSRRSETLQQAALTDSLTGMYNRRYFDDALKEYLSEFRRVDKPVGLMILDLDHFKQVNDTHGHDAGDDVLKAVANCLHEFTRYHDVVARLGGEEFAIVAPNMDETKLFKFADRIRLAVGGLVISTGNIRIKITTSVGLAIWDRRESAEDFYRRADKMLYQAKRQGRNRVCA